ncbi:MAG: Rieske 2Fe-2S domain-containing protein [Actinomycetota bacterium]
MPIVVAIVVILLVGGIGAFAFTARRLRSTGALSRETRERDQSQPTTETAAASASTTIEATGRERADETRGRFGGVPARRGGGDVVEWEPVDDEEIGVSRRQFFNRAILSVSGIAGAALGFGFLQFLWPPAGGGTGLKVNAGRLDDILNEIEETRSPKYIPDAKTYLRPYPKEALPAAKKVPNYAPVLPGMQAGLVGLWQRCVHLGCKVPWCVSSQWFECPCHGSKYNSVGEKKDGPAPRGLDRYRITIEDGDVIIDRTSVVTGPPIGTNTTKQQQEGSSCI